MARGRNQKRKAARDDQARRAEIAELRDAVAEQLRLVQEATVEAAHTDAQRQLTERLRQQRSDATEPARADIAALTRDIRDATGEAKRVHDRVERLYNSIRDSVARDSPSEYEALSRWVSLIGVMPEGVLVTPERMSGMSAQKVIGYLTAKGLISNEMREQFAENGPATAVGRTKDVEEWAHLMRPWLTGAFHEKILEGDDATLRAFDLLMDTDAWLPLADTARFWCQPLLIQTSAADIPDAFGVATTAEWADARVDLSLLERGSPKQITYAREGMVAGAAAVTPSPLHPLSVSSRPGDAVTVKYLYTQHAIGLMFDDADRDDPDDTPQASATSANRLLEAVTYWLPAGQADALAESTPLDNADVRDLRLPHESVLLTFGQPLRIDPFTDDEHDDLGHIDDWAIDFLLGSKWTSKELIRRIPEDTRKTWIDRGWPTLGAIIASRGARVEGLLLIGDDDGTVDDRFAWCVAVPGRAGNLARVVLPALRSKTAWKPQIDNLIAAVAWADWHEPIVRGDLTEEELEDRDTLASAVAYGLGVHVMDVRRTVQRSGHHKSTEPTRTVAPHPRRGYWRRQHHGPGNRQVKRVRIPPVIVNAGRASHTVNVYRLPAAALTDTRPPPRQVDARR